MTATELTDLMQRSAGGDTDASVELALLYRQGFAKIRMAEAIRGFHLILYKSLATQLAADFRPLLDKYPIIAETANKYKADPCIENLQRVLQVLRAVGEKCGEKWTLELSLVVSKAFKYVAQGYERIMEQAMPEYCTNAAVERAGRPFKAHPSLTTFTAMAVSLASEFKEYSDTNRFRALLVKAALAGNGKAAQLLSKSYGYHIVDVIATPTSGGLLGYSYSMVTMWDRLRPQSNTSH